MTMRGSMGGSMRKNLLTKADIAIFMLVLSRFYPVYFWFLTLEPQVIINMFRRHCTGGDETGSHDNCEAPKRDYNVGLRVGLLFVIMAASAIGTNPFITTRYRMFTARWQLTSNIRCLCPYHSTKIHAY